MWVWLGLVGLWFLKRRDERRRIGLLSGLLHPYAIEKLMAQLTEGYLRALGEADAARQQAIWAILEGPERELAQQVERACADVARWPAPQRRVLRRAWPLGLWWPQGNLDLHDLFTLHARGLHAVASNTAQHSAKAKAHRLLAEMLLLQHTCHWFCRSRAVASARLLARHKTPHGQVLDAVSPETRAAYRAVVGG